MQSILELLFNGHTLTESQSEQLFHAVIDGKLTDIQLSAALISLKIRGITPEEISGAVLATLKSAIPFQRPNYPFADIVGTGGDGSNSINISTASAIVSATMGFPIAKHGSTSVSSRSGASDVLTELGVDIHMSSDTARAALDELKLCFLFAQKYHPGFRHAATVRKTLKTRTLFNILGPLVNPAHPPYILLGVYEASLLPIMAKTLHLRGTKRAIIVSGNGLDEVTTYGETHVAELNKGEINYYTVTYADFGLPQYPLTELEGGTPAQNGQLLTALLRGEGKAAHNTAVALNTAMVMRLFGHENLADNAQQVLATIASGNAYQTIRQLANRG